MGKQKEIKENKKEGENWTGRKKIERRERSIGKNKIQRRNKKITERKKNIIEVKEKRMGSKEI